MFTLSKTTLNRLKVVVDTFNKDGTPCSKSMIVEMAINDFIKRLLIIGKEHEEDKNQDKEDERKC